MSTRLRESGRLLPFIGLATVGLLLAAAGIHSRFALSPYYGTFLHTVLEIVSILISFSVFIVNWESTTLTRNTQSLFIGTGFLSVASLDLMHVLSFPGMPDFFPPSSMSYTLYYWLLARLWAGAVLLGALRIAPGLRKPYTHRSVLLGANLVPCLIATYLVAVFGDQLPHLYVGDGGPTMLKALLEVGVILLYLVGVMGYARRYRLAGDRSDTLVMAALGLTISSELSLLLFSVPMDSFALLAHLFKVAAYYLIFTALAVTSVHRPYAELQVAKDRLERTVAALDARNRELDALDEVAVALGASLHPEGILETAIGRIMKVMDAGAAAIYLLDEKGREFKLATWRGLSPAAVGDCIGHSWRPVEIATAIDEMTEDRTSGDPMVMRRLGGPLARIAPLGACVCAPITHKGRLLGSMAMLAREGRSFTIKDADLLTAIGFQFGLAIVNARLYEQTDERLRQKIVEMEKAERRSRLLDEVGALFASGMASERVLELTAGKTVDVVGDCCCFYLLERTSGLLTLQAMHQRDSRELETMLSVFRQRPIPTGETLVGRVAVAGEPELQAMANRDEITAEISLLAESVEEVALLRRAAPASRAAVPFRALGRTAGVVLVSSANPWKPIGPSDLGLLEELAARIGVAIENRWLFQESQAQRQHLETIISQMVDGVIIADGSGRPLVVNAAAQKMLAGRQVDSLGSARRPVPDPGGLPSPQLDERSLVARALSGELVMGDEVIGEGPAGDTVLSASASPVREQDGTTTGAVVVLRDVTAEREVERMKDEFVATTSHELRTPITAVLGYTDILLKGLRGPLTAKQKEALESVRSAGVRLLALINDLLDMSRLEAGKQESQTLAVDSASAIERALSAVSVLAASKGIVLQQSLEPDLPPVLADDEQLQRILANLLSNAIKFTPAEGVVTVATRRVDGLHAGAREIPPSAVGRVIAVAVSDTGIGVPLEYQEKIWDKFQQVDSSSHRLFGGTGLGLAIARRLVELQGGRVWLQSEGVPGKGSTFGFTLKEAVGRGDSSPASDR